MFVGTIDYIKCNLSNTIHLCGGVYSLEKIYSDKINDGEFILLEDKGIVIIGTKKNEEEE